MASPNTKTLPQLVQGMAAAMQGQASGLLDFTVGSILRASTEAYAGVVLWLEGLVLAVLIASRASTCTGTDLDTWIADLASGPTPSDPTLISRFPAVGATGNVTFSRLSTTGQSVVPFYSTVSTRDGSQQYSVAVDPLNAAYSAPLAGYVMAIGVAAITVPVTAAATGAASNAVAGSVNTITSSIAGVDSVTNASAYTNGADAESDAAFLSRFRSFIQSLRRATPAALASAIQNLQMGAACKIVELQTYGGVTQKGYFYFVVDDGSGAPPASLVTAAGVVIDSNRAAGVEFGVYAPVIVTVAASIVVVTSATSVHATVVAIVQAAVANYINKLPLGQAVFFSRIWQVAHDASPDVVEISSLTLAGGSADVVITAQQVAKAGTIAVS